MKELWHLSALGILLLIPSGEAYCPEGFVSFFADPSIPMETCLLFAMDRKREWHEAHTYCNSLRSELANLDDGELHWQVIDYIHRNPDMLDEAFHIGCTDEVTEGKWLWVNGSPVRMGPPHWFYNQPDGGTRENYCCLYYDDFLYSSCVNRQTMYTICQI
ncbi:hepatic lectin-like isoform X2 [Palaemon carinicauda]|uniref:hepatic lectin-like isoform X2 n=1 Tax=Palaemon carinicauda TaxID=392227 RepID=UPI0035B5748B